MKPIRPRICKAHDPETGLRCNTKFVPDRPFVKWCSPLCGVHIAAELKTKKAAKQATEQRLAHRVAKIKARPLKWYEDRAQAAVNRYVVHGRDKDEGCISCGTRNPSIIYAAGHFRTRGAASHLRYNLDNLHKQCNFHCNSQLAGNILHYRPALIAKIGQERFDALINSNESRRYTVEELEEITKEFRLKMKELPRG